MKKGLTFAIAVSLFVSIVGVPAAYAGGSRVQEAVSAETHTSLSWSPVPAIDFRTALCLKQMALSGRQEGF